jgi:hypothetical protein
MKEDDMGVGGHVVHMGIKKSKGKFVPVLLTEHHARKGYWKSGGKAPLIL